MLVLESCIRNGYLFFVPSDWPFKTFGPEILRLRDLLIQSRSPGAACVTWLFCLPSNLATPRGVEKGGCPNAEGKKGRKN